MLPVSAIYIVPLVSPATPIGKLRLALVGLPPSPEEPCVPLPAVVEMVCPCSRDVPARLSTIAKKNICMQHKSLLNMVMGAY